MAEYDEDLTDFTQSSPVGDRATRRSYLITFSQVNKATFPTRESFAGCVVNAFNSAPGAVRVDYWACCLENHKVSGEHYHLAVKLSGPRRLKAIKNSVMDSHGGVLHFSNKHDNYNWAYKYICKVDKQVVLSPGHPNLIAVGPPRTSKCKGISRECTKTKERCM